MKTDTEIIQERSQEYCEHIRLISEEDAKRKRTEQRIKLKCTLRTGSNNYASRVYEYIISYLEWKSVEHILYHPDFSDQQKFDCFNNIYQLFKNHKVQRQITFF